MIRCPRSSPLAAAALAALGCLCFRNMPAQESNKPAPLELGKTAERSASARGQASWLIHVSLHQFSRVRLEPDGLELSATLRSPAGDKITEATNPVGERKPILISWEGSAD